MKQAVNDRKTGRPFAVPNLDERLTPAERLYRKRLLALIIETSRPVAAGEAVSGTGLEPEECEKLSRSLEAKGILARSGGEVAFVYPVSALPTSHRVLLADGRTFYAMCAIDALGAVFEFDRDAVVNSSCSHCRRPLTVTLAGGRLKSADPPDIQVLHVDLDRYRDWAASC